MFAGHVGAALMGGRGARRTNVGLLAFAALLLDVVLWLLVLAGGESVSIPVDFAHTHQPQFVFPWSHGLVAAVIWSILASGAVLRWFPAPGARRAAVIVALLVFSHWSLDVLVHRPELPLAGDASAKVGLGLRVPLALSAEALLVAVGLALFLPGAGLPRARVGGILVVTLTSFAMTVAGATVVPPPPSSAAMAASSLVTVLVVCLLLGRLGRYPTSQSSSSPLP